MKEDTKLLAFNVSLSDWEQFIRRGHAAWYLKQTLTHTNTLERLAKVDMAPVAYLNDSVFRTLRVDTKTADALKLYAKLHDLTQSQAMRRVVRQQVAFHNRSVTNDNQIKED